MITINKDHAVVSFAKDEKFAEISVNAKENELILNPLIGGGINIRDTDYGENKINLEKSVKLEFYNPRSVEILIEALSYIHRNLINKPVKK